LIFDKVTDKNMLARFLWPTVYIDCYRHNAGNPTLNMKLVIGLQMQFKDMLFIVVITYLSFFWLVTLVLASHVYCFDLQ